MQPPRPVVLTGEHVRLEPLDATHVADLVEAAQDPVVWRWLPSWPQSPEDIAVLVEAARTDPGRVAFAVMVDGRAVGSTSYLDIEPELGGIEIGWTWYAPSVWRTAVNPACKLLLLGHAFDDLGAERVTLKTDALNVRSRSAIGRLGAAYDGTLRHHHRRPDGTIRDTAFFSILAAEWPAVCDSLVTRLGGAG